MFLSLIYRDRRGRAAIENRIGFLRSYLRWRGQGSHYPAITCKSNWLWEEPRIAYQQSPHVLFYLASTGIETQLKAIKESMPIPASLYKKWKTPPAMTAEEIWFTTTRLSKVISRPQIVKISTQDVLLNPSLNLLIEIVQSGIWRQCCLDHTHLLRPPLVGSHPFQHHAYLEILGKQLPQPLSLSFLISQWYKIFCKSIVQFK